MSRSVTSGKLGRPAAGSSSAGKPASAKAASATAKAASTAKAARGLDFKYERALLAAGEAPLAGADEVGRGPWAGPVVAAAVILDPKRVPRGLDDSKKLSREQREALFDIICATAQVALAFAPPARIDGHDIRKATLWALARAAASLPVRPRLLLVDGRDVPDVPCATRVIIGGDGIVASIAAASIVAKVTRDRLMASLGMAHPGYGFERHMGYGTPEHQQALERLGACRHHRASFAPIRERLARGEGQSGVEGCIEGVLTLRLDAAE